MKTATDALRDHEEERTEGRLNMAIRDFIKRFEPEERRDRLDFEMALHYLVREIYREASKPYEKALMGALIVSSQIFPLKKTE